MKSKAFVHCAVMYSLAAMVKGNCPSTKPTRLTFEEVCHLDSEYALQNPLALPGIGPGTYCTLSKNSTKYHTFRIYLHILFLKACCPTECFKFTGEID